MKTRVLCVLLIAVLIGALIPASLYAGRCGSRPCLPDDPIPPESVGPISVPFDVPLWPTLLKTEFLILPWVSFGKSSVCIPGTSVAVEFFAPCVSLKPIPIWIPWLRPLDAECKDPAVCGTP